MSRRLLLILAIFAFAAPGLVVKAQQQPAANPQPQGPPGILRGVVVREGTSDPIRDVRITVGSNTSIATNLATATLLDSIAAAGLNAASVQGLIQNLTAVPGGVSANAVGPQFNATTDSNGRFSIEGIPPGRYAVIAQREGYFGGQQGGPTQAVPSPTARGTANIASQQTAEVSLTMIPGGAISGRVLGTDGMPVSNVQVEVLRLTYANGVRTLQAVNQKPSDDRGEYRLFQLPPGEYYLAVQPRLVATGLRGAPTNGAPQEIQARTFYPSATDARNALPIALRPGDELTGMNLQIQSIVGSKVSGRVVSQLPANAPVPPAAAAYISNRGNMATLTLLPHDAGAFIDQRLSAGVTVSLASPNNGAFEIPNVPAGTYDLYASLPDPTGWGPAAPPGQATQPMGYGRTSIDVRGGDLSGITVSVHQGVDVRGQVLVDGKPAPAPVRVSLQPADSSTTLPIYTQIGRGMTPIQQDGTFLIPVVPEATYRMQPAIVGAAQFTAQYAQRGGRAGQIATGTQPPPTPSPLPAAAYIADVRQGGMSVYDNGISIGTSLVSPLEVLVNTNGGTIQGAVFGAGQQPVTTGALVVLMPPISRRQNLALYKTTQVNAQGAFTIGAVPPGSYSLFAWESIPANAYQNPDFMKTYEDRGVSVTVQPGAAISQSLAVIPPEKK